MCDDFCLIHGYEHMRKHSIFDKIAYCAECEMEDRIKIVCENPSVQGYTAFVDGNKIGVWSTYIDAELAAKSRCKS